MCVTSTLTYFKINSICSQCNGVVMKQDPLIHWCCLVTESVIRYRKPRDMILYYRQETPMKCQRGSTGRNCDRCAPIYGPPGQCDLCLRGWTGENCSECDTNFGPPGQCDQCLRTWAGQNCNLCAANFLDNVTNAWEDGLERTVVSVPQPLNLLDNVINALEDGLERTAVNVQPTLDLLDNVTNAWEDGLERTAVNVQPTLELLDNVPNV